MKNNSGFIALLSTIIISTILLLVATSLNFISFYSRSDILDSELKEKSSALAEACADTAILNLAKNIDYTGDVIVGSDSDKCIIQSVSGGIINVKADYKNYVTKLKIVVNSTDRSIVSWGEVL